METNQLLISEIRKALANSAVVVDVLYKRCPAAADKIDLVKHLNWMVEQGEASRDDTTRAYYLTSGTLSSVKEELPPRAIEQAASVEPSAPAVKEPGVTSEVPAPAEPVAKSVGSAVVVDEPSKVTNQPADNLGKSTTAVLIEFLSLAAPLAFSRAELCDIFPKRTRGSIDQAIRWWLGKGQIYAPEPDIKPVKYAHKPADAAQPAGPDTQPSPQTAPSVAVEVQKATFQPLSADIDRELAELLPVVPIPLREGFKIGVKSVLVITIPDVGELELEAAEAFLVVDFVKANEAQLRATA